MNRNEESSLPGITSVPSIPRHGSEGYLLTTTPPNDRQYDARQIQPSFQSRTKNVLRSGTHQQHVTDRRRVVQRDAADAEQHLIRFQIETATAEHELSVRPHGGRVTGALRAADAGNGGDGAGAASGGADEAKGEARREHGVQGGRPGAAADQGAA